MRVSERKGERVRERERDRMCERDIVLGMERVCGKGGHVCC